MLNLFIALCGGMIAMWALSSMGVIATLLEAYYFDMEDNVVDILKDNSNLNFVGRIICGVAIYLIVPLWFILDIIRILQFLFTYHPQKKKKTEQQEKRILSVEDFLNSIKEYLYIQKDGICTYLSYDDLEQLFDIYKKQGDLTFKVQK